MRRITVLSLSLALAAISGSSLTAFAQSAVQPPYLPQPAPIAAGVPYPVGQPASFQAQPQLGLQVAPPPPGMMAAPVMMAPSGMMGPQFMQGAAPPAAAMPIVPPGGVIAPIATQALPIAGSMPQYFQPLPTVALTNTYTAGSPYVTQQTQIYTPSYYYYYQGAPAPQQQPQMAAPMMMGVMPMMGFDMGGGMGGGFGGMSASQFGPMSNARGEMGHVRYPYYSYRRPWYFPGQPSFNTTIDGPVW